MGEHVQNPGQNTFNDMLQLACNNLQKRNVYSGVQEIELTWPVYGVTASTSAIRQGADIFVRSAVVVVRKQINLIATQTYKNTAVHISVNGSWPTSSNHFFIKCHANVGLRACIPTSPSSQTPQTL